MNTSIFQFLAVLFSIELKQLTDFCLIDYLQTSPKHYTNRLGRKEK
ncbi:hypothetical protein HCG51_34700 (plasmid) [Tolypothrix sp. PCC 7910]|nr:hypothetical protein [Tolypothrix sp. PCC 7910]QIR41836.1 hypothetical protein HCG51_34700 [Tolypothrix sp. PCC 7910]